MTKPEHSADRAAIDRAVETPRTFAGQQGLGAVEQADAAASAASAAEFAAASGTGAASASAPQTMLAATIPAASGAAAPAPAGTPAAAAAGVEPAPAGTPAASAAEPPRDPSTRHPRLQSAVEALVLIAVPVVLFLCAWFQVEQAALLSMAVAVAAVAVFFVGYEASKPALRQIMPTVVLGALAAAGRIVFAAIPDFKPVSAICILAGVVFGRRSGFMVGAIAALVSNFFFGQGAWTPWQMYAWGLVGYLAGVLADHGWLDHLPLLYVYGFCSALLYGLLLNGWYVIGYVHPITWPAVVAAYLAGLPFDLVHGAATVAFLAVLYVPWRRKLLRIKRKFALV